MSHRVVLIPGDGIGPEVTDAARQVLDASGAGIEWVNAHAGAELQERTGLALPDSTLAAIRDCGVALKGPVTTRAGQPGPTVSVAMRRELDLYAGVRPCRSFPGIAGPAGEVDVVVIRMTGEDLYAGIGYEAGAPATSELRKLIRATTGVELGEDAAISIRPISHSAALRLARFAFEYARRHARTKVTAVHKATAVHETDGLFLDAAREAAEEYPDVGFDDVLVDACCAGLVRRPRDYDVLLLPVVYGDIVSDLCAALVGGPGLAPGANIGPDCAVFEASHGSVPKYSGQQRANPLAVILSGAMMLRHLNELAAAERVEAAVRALLSEGATLPRDLAPASATAATTSAVADALSDDLAAQGRSRSPGPSA